MSFATDLKALIQSFATQAGNEVYLGLLPQNASLPAVSMNTASGGSYEEHLTGVAPIGQSVWHIYTYGATYEQAENLAEEVRKQLHRFDGTFGASYIDDVSANSFLQSGMDKAKDGSYVPRYWHLTVYTITHRVAEIT